MWRGVRSALATAVPYSVHPSQINPRKRTLGYPILVQPPVRRWSRRKTNYEKYWQHYGKFDNPELKIRNPKCPSRAARSHFERCQSLRSPDLPPASDASLSCLLVVPANAPRRGQRRRVAACPGSPRRTSHPRSAPPHRSGHQVVTGRVNNAIIDRCHASDSDRMASGIMKEQTM